MFTPEDCELIRRLADGVTPMGWMAISCRSAGEIANVLCRFRDPNPRVGDREIEVYVEYQAFQENRRDLADYLRGLLNAYIQSEGVYL